MTTDLAPLKIGELAKQSQVSIKTIRYYESLGLLQTVGRSTGGFRLFDTSTLRRLDFIRRSQQLGLSLQEIGDLLNIHDRGELPCVEVRQTFQAKIVAIDCKIAELQQLKAQLQQMIETPISSSGLVESNLMTDAICPIIQP